MKEIWKKKKSPKSIYLTFGIPIVIERHYLFVSKKFYSDFLFSLLRSELDSFLFCFILFYFIFLIKSQVGNIL